MKKRSSEKSKPKKAKPESLEKPGGLTLWERLQQMPYDLRMTGQGFIIMGASPRPDEGKNKNEEKLKAGGQTQKYCRDMMNTTRTGRRRRKTLSGQKHCAA